MEIVGKSSEIAKKNGRKNCETKCPALGDYGCAFGDLADDAAAFHPRHRAHRFTHRRGDGRHAGAGDFSHPARAGDSRHRVRVGAAVACEV